MVTSIRLKCSGGFFPSLFYFRFNDFSLWNGAHITVVLLERGRTSTPKKLNFTRLPSVFFQSVCIFARIFDQPFFSEFLDGGLIKAPLFDASLGKLICKSETVYFVKKSWVHVSSLREEQSFLGERLERGQLCYSFASESINASVVRRKLPFFSDTSKRSIIRIGRSCSSPARFYLIDQGNFWRITCFSFQNGTVQLADIRPSHRKIQNCIFCISTACFLYFLG